MTTLTLRSVKGSALTWVEMDANWSALLSGKLEVSAVTGAMQTFLATPTSANLAAAVSDETGTGALVFANSPTFITPALGTPASGVLTNCTALPLAAINGFAAGVATFLATPSSANLLAAMTSKTGTGNLVFATSPTFITPALGTPASGNLANCTGVTAAGGGTGQSVYAIGDILYASGTAALSILSAGAATYVLTSNGAGTAPSWQAAAGGSFTGGLLTSVLGIVAGTVTAPGLYFSGDTNTGIYSAAADNLNITTGGTVRMSITNSGADILPNSNGINFSTGGIRIGTTHALGWSSTAGGNGGSWSAYFEQTTTNILKLTTNAVERFRVDASGLFNIAQTALTAQFGVQSTLNTRVVAIVKGAASQSSNLQEWHDSAGTVLAAVSAGGSVGIGISSPNANAKLDVDGAILSKVYTVATLPTATNGLRAFVSNATATTFASTVAGGGSNKVPVYSDGTNWLIG